MTARVSSNIKAAPRKARSVKGVNRWNGPPAIRTVTSDTGDDNDDGQNQCGWDSSLIEIKEGMVVINRGWS